MIDVEKLAREALQELDSYSGDIDDLPTYGGGMRDLERFARLVLEEAAKACDDRANEYRKLLDSELEALEASECAKAIRALLPAQEV